MQDNVTADTTNFSLTAPAQVFGKWLTTIWWSPTRLQSRICVILNCGRQ